MSSWVTLNIEGIEPDDLPVAFDDWWVYSENGMTIAYSFNTDMPHREAAERAALSGDHQFEPSVESILALRCNDTSDYVQATLYKPKEVKWNGVKSSLTWNGHHSWGKQESEFLANTPDGKRPVFGGNWKDKIGDDSPAQRLEATRDNLKQ